MSRPAEQILLLHEVLAGPWITDWSLAIDGGAHIGDWSLAMATRFAKVISFEPTPETFALLRERVTAPNIELRNQALLDRPRGVQMMSDAKRTKLSSRYVGEAEGSIEAIRLDSLGLESCGLLKLDLEGAELPALRGARKLIRRHHPVVILEVANLGQRFGYRDSTLRQYMIDLGYRCVLARWPDEVWAKR